MSFLSESDLALLRWTQKTIDARNRLDPAQELGLRQWQEQGGKRSDWPGWEILFGPKPGERKKLKAVAVRISRRKTA